MKFFNSQNCQRERTPAPPTPTQYDTVWFNYEGPTAHHFYAKDPDDGTPVTVTIAEFYQATNKKINFSYVGGVHECNYTLFTRPIDDDSVSLEFSLRTITKVYKSTSYIIWDYANAVFNDAKPIMEIRIVYNHTSGTYNVYFDDITSRFNAPRILTTVDTGETKSDWQAPTLYLDNTDNPVIVPTTAINMQTWIMQPWVPYMCKATVQTTQVKRNVPLLAWFVVIQPESVKLHIVPDPRPSEGQDWVFNFDPTVQPYQHIELVVDVINNPEDPDEMKPIEKAIDQYY